MISCPSLPIFIASLTLGVATVSAVDPLPPHIESADEEVKLAYIERTSRESEERKIEVGIRRHKERMLYKSQLANNQRVEAMERLAQRRTFAAAALDTARTSGRKGYGKSVSIFAGVVAIGLVVTWLRRRRSAVA